MEDAWSVNYNIELHVVHKEPTITVRKCNTFNLTL